MTNCANNLATKDDINALRSLMNVILTILRNGGNCATKADVDKVYNLIAINDLATQKNIDRVYKKVNDETFNLKQNINRVYDKVNDEFYQVKVKLDRLYDKVNNDDFEIKQNIKKEADRIIEEIKRNGGGGIDIDIKNQLALLIPIRAELTLIKTSILSLKAEVSTIKLSINSFNLILNNIRLDVQSLRFSFNQLDADLAFRFNSLQLTITNINLVLSRLTNRVELTAVNVASLRVAVNQISLSLGLIKSDSQTILNNLQISLRNQQEIKNTLFILFNLKQLIDQLIRVSNSLQLTLNNVNNSIRTIDTRTVTILTETNEISNEIEIITPLIDEIKEDTNIVNLPLLNGECNLDGYDEKEETAQSIGQALVIVNKQVEDIKKAVCELDSCQNVLLPDPSAVWNTVGKYMFFYWKLETPQTKLEKVWNQRTQLADPIDELITAPNTIETWETYFANIYQILGNQWGEARAKNKTRKYPIYKAWFSSIAEGRRFFESIKPLTKQEFAETNNPFFTTPDNQTVRLVNQGKKIILRSVCIAEKIDNSDKFEILNGFKKPEQ